MNVQEIEAVLAAHERVTGIRDLRQHCTCGWRGDEWQGIRSHRHHVAVTLLNEGWRQ